MHIVQVQVRDYPPDLQEGDIVCKRSSGWISYDNYIHMTQPNAKICTKLRRFIHQRQTSSGIWSRDVDDERVTKILK